jgi:hypothetical protein
LIPSGEIRRDERKRTADSVPKFTGRCRNRGDSASVYQKAGYGIGDGVAEVGVQCSEPESARETLSVGRLDVKTLHLWGAE